MTLAFLQRFSLQNPVLAKDLRTRMRGKRAYIAQALYVGLLAAMVTIAYFNWLGTNPHSASALTLSTQLGPLFYQLIFQTQAALLVIFVPALTASAITIEHEQRTYEMLACTRISPRTVVVGKLLSATLFMVMLLTCSLPMATLSMVFGGVSPTEIADCYLMLCLCALFFGSVGVFCSSAVPRSSSAIMASLAIVFGYLVLTLAVDPTGLSYCRLLNPFGFIGARPDHCIIYMTSLPSWLPALVILPLATLLLLNMAMGRLPNFNADRAWAIRLLLPALVLTLVLLGTGLGSQDFVLHGGLALLLLVCTLVVSGQLPRPLPRSLVGWLAGGIRPRRLLSSSLSGGWAYAVLLMAAFIGSLLLAHSLGPAPAARIAGSFVLGPAVALRLVAMVAAVVLCYGAVGALGAVLGSRAVGLSMLGGVFFFTHLAPLRLWIFAHLVPGAAEGSRLLYLAPYLGAHILCHPQAAKQLPASLRPPAPPLWQMTAVIYLGITLAVLLVAELIYQVLRRTRGRAELAAGGS